MKNLGVLEEQEEGDEKFFVEGYTCLTWNIRLKEGMWGEVKKSGIVK